MELIRISTDKMKIMLTPADMSQFELNAEDFGGDGKQTRRSVRLLLEELRRRTGFNADDRRVSVQYFPSREGGCEMFISNLTPGENDCPEEAVPLLPASERGVLPRPSKRGGTGFRRECAYGFSEFGDLLSVCGRLSEVGYTGESSAYRDEERQYYLLLSLTSPSPFSLPDELGFLPEYGKAINASYIKLYLREHANPLCPRDAVSTLARLK